jgi:hypothetical protein
MMVMGRFRLVRREKRRKNKMDCDQIATNQNKGIFVGKSRWNEKIHRRKSTDSKMI